MTTDSIYILDDTGSDLETYRCESIKELVLTHLMDVRNDYQGVILKVDGNTVTDVSADVVQEWFEQFWLTVETADELAAAPDFIEAEIESHHYELMEMSGQSESSQYGAPAIL